MKTGEGGVWFKHIVPGAPDPGTFPGASLPFEGWDGSVGECHIPQYNPWGFLFKTREGQDWGTAQQM